MLAHAPALVYTLRNATARMRTLIKRADNLRVLQFIWCASWRVVRFLDGRARACALARVCALIIEIMKRRTRGVATHARVFYFCTPKFTLSLFGNIGEHAQDFDSNISSLLQT